MSHQQTATETAEETEQDFRAACIADDFERAARHKPDAAYYLSTGLYSLQLHAMRDAPAISIASAVRLLRTCAAIPDILAEWAADEDRERAVRRGIFGAETLIRFWAEAPTVRIHRPSGQIHEANLSVRWLRNECHNMSIELELAERRSKRGAA